MLYTLGNHKSKKIQYKYICCNFVYSKVESIELILGKKCRNQYRNKIKKDEYY